MIKCIQPSEVDEKDIVPSEMDIEGLDEFRRVPFRTELSCWNIR